MPVNLYKYPFVRVVLMYGAGIYLAWYIHDRLPLPVVAGITLTLFIVAVLTHFSFKSYASRWVTGLFIHLLLFASGFWTATMAFDRQNDKHFSKFEPGESYLIRLSEPLVERRGSYRTIAQVKAIIADSTVVPVSGKILLFLKKPLDSALPAYGDYLVIHQKPEMIAPALNPGQFNFSEYMARRGVMHQVFIDASRWNTTGYTARNFLFALAYNTRDHFMEAMRLNGLKGDEFAVASAILLGYDEMLSHELRRGYTGAGAMHILCVSGLHVGIIFLLFNTLLRFLDRFRRGAIIRAFVLLGIVWFYAFVTGLSPSVMRSALMISFMLIGQTLRRKGQAINTLAAAAFLILFIDPASLFSIGFQLSFAAVAGILLFQPALAQWLTFRNKVLDYFWEATSVALAAQLSTTPLVLLYFNQFPLYFWLSNLFLTPLSFLIIALGMLLLLSSPLPWLPHALAMVTSSLIYAMNVLVQQVEALPMAVLKSLYINVYEAFLLSFALLMVAFWVKRQSHRFFIPLMVSTVLLTGSFAWRHVNNLRQEGFLVYALPKPAAMSFVRGHQHVFMADSAVLHDEGLIEFYMNRFWNKHEITSPIKVDLKNNFWNEFMVKEGPFIVFGGQMIQLWDMKKPLKGADADVYLILGHLPKSRTTPEMPGTNGLLLLDASLNASAASKWGALAKSKGRQHYNVRLEGAYAGGNWKKRIP